MPRHRQRCAWEHPLPISARPPGRARVCRPCSMRAFLLPVGAPALFWQPRTNSSMPRPNRGGAKPFEGAGWRSSPTGAESGRWPHGCSALMAATGREYIRSGPAGTVSMSGAACGGPGRSRLAEPMQKAMPRQCRPAGRHPDRSIAVFFFPAALRPASILPPMLARDTDVRRSRRGLLADDGCRHGFSRNGIRRPSPAFAVLDPGAEEIEHVALLRGLEAGSTCFASESEKRSRLMPSLVAAYREGHAFSSLQSAPRQTLAQELALSAPVFCRVSSFAGRTDARERRPGLDPVDRRCELLQTLRDIATTPTLRRGPVHSDEAVTECGAIYRDGRPRWPC